MMTGLASKALAPAQADRLRRFNAVQSVDLHCHCLSGLDDGPVTLVDAIALCRALVEDGITTVVATPHQLGRYDGLNSPIQVRAAAVALRQALAAEGIQLDIQVGGDVRVDERLASLVAADKVLTLADGKRYLLLELPHEVPVDPRPLLRSLVQRGIVPIVSHPERYAYLHKKLSSIRPWIDDGAILQITAGSLVGDFGGEAQAAAWKLLSAGCVSVVATDAHDVVRRPPRMTAAIAIITERMSHVVARRLCIENPATIIEGRDLPPIAAANGGRR